jgi:hypothetical protein
MKPVFLAAASENDTGEWNKYDVDRSIENKSARHGS